MQVDGVALREPRTFVHYQSQQDALKFLGRILRDERGVALLHGRKLAGKSVVVNQLVRKFQNDMAIAVVDGTRLNTTDFLSRILEQFGYNVSLDSTDEMLNMVNMFVVQQTRARQAPVLVIENINDMFPSALGALCKLASLRVNRRFALRLVLVSNRNIGRVIDSPSMTSIANRVIGIFELGPMTSTEAARYIYAKMQSVGVERPDDIFSVEACEKLHLISGGWPGDTDELVISTIQQVDQFPVRLDDIVDPDAPVVVDSPKFIITLSGESPREIRLTEKRALIGRSSLSDIVVVDQFVSSQHALLIRNESAVVLVDLKSRNGTFVNSRRVQSKVLLHDDIVSLGDHRMKVVYAEGHSMPELEDLDLADTARMKNIADARRAREQEIPTLIAVADKKE